MNKVEERKIRTIFGFVWWEIIEQRWFPEQATMPIFASLRRFNRIFEEFSIWVIKHPGEQGFDIEMINFGSFILFPFTRRRDLFFFFCFKRIASWMRKKKKEKRKKTYGDFMIWEEWKRSHCALQLIVIVWNLAKNKGGMNQYRDKIIEALLGKAMFCLENSKTCFCPILKGRIFWIFRRKIIPLFLPEVEKIASSIFTIWLLSWLLCFDGMFFLRFFNSLFHLIFFIFIFIFIFNFNFIFRIILVLVIVIFLFNVCIVIWFFSAPNFLSKGENFLCWNFPILNRIRIIFDWLLLLIFFLMDY